MDLISGNETTTVDTRRVHIGSVIRNALVFDFKNWDKNTVDSDSIPQTVVQLFALLDEREIDYLLVGGIALLQYIEGRNTEDIDLIVAVASLKQLPEIEIESRDIYFARGKFNGLKVDLLLTSNPLFKKVQQHYATTQLFVERDISCATPEGLLLLKLYALPSLYRQGNFAQVGIYENDIATLLHDYRPAVEPLFAELSNHLSDTDLAAVRRIVSEIEERIARFGSSFDQAS